MSEVLEKVFTRTITVDKFDAEMLFARIKFIEGWIRTYDGDASGDAVKSIETEYKQLMKL